jgi:hypothetical protein
MKNIKLLLVVLSILILSGCTYHNVEGDPNYVELYEDKNSGWYVNTEQPLLVIDDSIIIPLIADYRLYGDWLIGTENGDAVLTFTTDNLIYIENTLMGEWYWGSTDTILAIMYGENEFNEPSISSLRFVFLDGTNDFAQFIEYDTYGNVITFLGVHVE